MEVAYRDRALEAMAQRRAGDGTYSVDIVRAFLKCIDIIRAAPDTRTIRAFKSRKLEKLSGDRRGQYSMRLNDQWRLILEFSEQGENTAANVIEIEDYH